MSLSRMVIVSDEGLYLAHHNVDRVTETGLAPRAHWSVVSHGLVDSLLY